MQEKKIIKPGERVSISLAYSEVCVHMGVAGKRMLMELTPGGMAQLIQADGRQFSFPITTGEAGIYRDWESGEYYTYV